PSPWHDSPAWSDPQCTPTQSIYSRRKCHPERERSTAERPPAPGSRQSKSAPRKESETPGASPPATKSKSAAALSTPTIAPESAQRETEKTNTPARSVLEKTGWQSRTFRHSTAGSAAKSQTPRGR